MKITLAAPAKINLWLRVGGRDASGYHELSTLFCALDLADTVILRPPAGGTDPELDVSAAAPLETVPDLGPAGSNLAVRAARRFMEAAGQSGAPRIRLVKRIPAGGGLGGGSSDAAAVLRALSRLYPRALPRPDLLQMAGEIGSDVPFFILASPFAHGEGRGERLTPVDPLPARTVVLALPPFGIPTADAYRWLDEDRERERNAGATATAPGAGESTMQSTQLSWAAVADRAVNDFERPVFGRHPRLREIRDHLLDGGARIALLAGSGSTVFGVFDDPNAAKAATDRLAFDRPELRLVVTTTRTR